MGGRDIGDFRGCATLFAGKTGRRECAISSLFGARSRSCVDWGPVEAGLFGEGLRWGDGNFRTDM